MIVEMKRLMLVAHKADEANILKALQDIEAVQVLSISDEEKPSDALDKVELRGAKLTYSLEAIKPYAKKAGMLSPRREETLQEVMDRIDAGVELSGVLEDLVRKKNNCRAEQEKNFSLISALRPFENFPYPMEKYVQQKHVHFFLGLVAQKDVPLLQAQDYLSIELYSEGSTVSALVACHEDDAKNASSFLKSIDWTDVVFPKMEGTPRAAMKLLQDRNEELEKLILEITEQIKAHAQSSAIIEDAADATRIERDRLKAATELKRTMATFALEGWVRTDEIEKVQSAIEKVTDAFNLDVRDPNEDEIPPSVVKNNKFVTPFEQVQTLYSRPTYGGIDGTPFMTPCYVLLFGLMLSDAGYGLLLMLGSWLYIKLKKPTGMSGGISRVLYWGGLSTIVWGVLLGTFFGLSLKEEIGLFPLWFDPMTDSMTMLALCFGLGIVHILFGYVLKMKVAFSKKDWQTAIFDALSWIFIISGLVMYMLPLLGIALPEVLSKIGLGMALVGAALILLFKGRGKKNPFKRTIAGFGELYNISSVLSDILSYARLFALGIATGVIATVFNQLCAMLMGGSGILKILGILIACVLLVALHLFNVAINTLGAFVHCARLQYVEFYGKFYEAGGREFTPLGYRTKHIQVTK
ncbi:MAG: V-type ATP synthase subunit I [Eubacteriales bacterium]|nr:V-type ATP synthase subunit I [Eubacteriales bacterium]